MFPVGHRFTFTTPYTLGPTDWTDEAFAARVGTEAELLGIVDPTTYDAAEVGPLYLIRFIADGVPMTAWPEEIDPTLIVGGTTR
jgi:hypothetical protein